MSTSGKETESTRKQRPSDEIDIDLNEISGDQLLELMEQGYEFVDDESAIEVPVEGNLWRCDLGDYSCEDTDRPVRRGRGFGGGQDDDPLPGFSAQRRPA